MTAVNTEATMIMHRSNASKRVIFLLFIGGLLSSLYHHSTIYIRIRQDNLTKNDRVFLVYFHKIPKRQLKPGRQPSAAERMPQKKRKPPTLPRACEKEGGFW
jgi:hypothetical protein